MKKYTLQDFNTLIEYFNSVRTHAVSSKYQLLELSKQVIDDFTDNIVSDKDTGDRLVMTNYEIDNYNKKLDGLRKVFDFTIFIHDFAEGEINRFSKEIEALSAKDDEKIN